MTQAHIQRIAVATPPHEVHDDFLRFAVTMLKEERAQQLFRRMAEKSGIHKRYSCLSVTPETLNPRDVDAYKLFQPGGFPSTGRRMQLFEQLAKPLLHRTLDRLALTPSERHSIQHVVVTCCTGFYAPGLDFDILDHLHLPFTTERTFVGFMGCYAAINGLKLAHHIVRSAPSSRVLMVNLELCTLHLQETQDLNKALSFLIFGDGCAASLIGADSIGFALDGFACIPIPDTRDLITWRIGDHGFDMHLSGQVPGRISATLSQVRSQLPSPQDVELWAVHPGGRSVLDGVAAGLGLDRLALRDSRCILNNFGNLSSATIMFVLASMLQNAHPGQTGLGMSFGPGLIAETMRFHAVK